MSSNSQWDGDALPLGIAPPNNAEIEHARRTMRHMLVEAPPASGTLCGFPVEQMTDLDRALAFDWLWRAFQMKGGI